MIDTVFGN